MYSPLHLLKIQFNIILTSKLVLPSCVLPSDFPTETLYTLLISPHFKRTNENL